MERENKSEKGLLNKYSSQMIKSAIVTAILIGIIAAIFFKGYSDAAKKYEDTIADLQQQIDELSNPTAVYTKATDEISIDLIESEIKDIGEIISVEYLYTTAGKYEDPKKLFGVNVPFTTKSFIAKWDGVIKAGINIEKVDVKINDMKKEIIVYMPSAEILSHEIDSNSVETLDEKDGLFNPVKIEDVRLFDAESKGEMEARAVENGILDKASKNAKEIIENLLYNNIVQKNGYIIKFEVTK